MKFWRWSNYRSVLFLIITATLIYCRKCILSSDENISSCNNIQNTQEEMMEIIRTRDGNEPLYVLGAYLIREDFLRVIVITDCSTGSKIYASFIDKQNIIKVAAENMSAVFGNCHIQACKYDGMYAEFEFPTKFIENQVFLDVVDVNNQSSSAVITVRRSVEPSKRKHRLAVCLPALFYYSDTVQLIEFMENWLLAGATKFYVYWQAITPAIKKVLLFYQQSGVDLEMIIFPHLHNRKLDLLVYYTGQLVTINDCLHRARSEAEFAAIVDLDELMVTTSTNLMAFIKRSKINSAGWYLPRTHAHFEKEPVYSHDAQKLSFAPLGEIHSEKKGSAFTKLILRPENVRRSFVHWITELEPSKEGVSNLDPSEAMLIHLRSFKENFDENKYEMSDILAKISQKMTASWKLRLNVTDNELLRLPITRSIPDIALAMESCLFKLKSDSRCFTGSHCVPFLMNNTTTVVDWQYSVRAWIEM